MGINREKHNWVGQAMRFEEVTPDGLSGAGQYPLIHPSGPLTPRTSRNLANREGHEHYLVWGDVCIWREGQHAHDLADLIQLASFSLTEVLSCMSEKQHFGTFKFVIPAFQ